MVAIPLVFNSGLTNTYAGPTNSDPGVGGATSAESGVGLEQAINIWDLDLASLACPLSELESITVEGIYTKSAGLDTVRDGGLVWLGDITTFTPWGTISAPQGDLNPPATNLPGSVTRDITLAGGTVASSGDPIGGTWSDPTPPTVLHLFVLADANGTNANGETVSVSLPTVTATFAPGSACAAVVPNTVDDTATTPVNVPVTVSVGTNDDPSPCAPGCMVHRQPTTNFIDPASTATGITASVDVAGVATVEASGPGTAIIHVESGCSPSCDANGGDVTAWTTQTLTVTVTPAVVPGACVEIGPVFDPAKTAALAATLGMEQGTATEVNATAGVGTEWAVGVYTVTIPVGCENDIESITAQSTINASGGVNALNDGALLAVTDDYSTLTPWGTVAPTAGTESVLQPGFLWTGFGGQGGPTPIGNLLEGAWSAGPLPKTEFDLVVITDARGADTPDGEYVIAEAPKVCVTYAEGSPCAPTPLPCVEVPVTFSQADTDAIGLAFGIDPTTDPTSVEADADVAGKQTVGVWLIEIPEGCTGEVVSVQAAATVDISATMDPDADGAFIAVVDSIVPPTGWGTLAPTTGDPNLQIPGSLSTGYVPFGGTAWPAGPSTVTLDGVWSAGTLPASTLALLVYADALGESPSGSNIRVNVPETVCVTFATENCPPAADPIPVDDTASTTTGTTITVDAAANDNNTPCDPLPGCAVYREGVPFIDPGSTATGITASIDAAGEVTVNATSAGTAIVTIESGCSPSCDPLGADVTVWVPQTLTVTFSEPAGPCETVNAIYDPAASAFLAGFVAGTAGGPGGPTGQGSQGPTISVYQVDAPSVCVATIASVQVQSTVTASPGFDPTSDHLTVAVFSDLSTFTIWGTPTAVSGQANITFPGTVSSGYTSGGGTLVPLIDATWSGGPATSPIYVVVVADASESAPGESIAGSAPILCVEFGDPDCPPASNPKPADVVKLCVVAAPQAGCALFGGTPSPTMFVAVSGPDGNVIPASSTSYPSNSVGGSDGSGYIRSYYTTTSGLVVTPDAGSWTPGSCGTDALQLPAGAVSIANGVYAATLGPNGSNWFPPAGLKSVTVYARHAATNDDATAGGSPGRVEVFVNSNVFMPLDGESFTWSVDDPDDLTTLTEVRCTADAAATVTWVSA